VRVGAVNIDKHASVGAQFDVTDFPTILMFGGRDKKKPINLTRG
jgi:thioredoxin-like negative regulator of GroEL